jgi:membrane-bound metal-dependent hydrolase YbcI (DUF457 family)
MLARTHVLSGACAWAGLAPTLGVGSPLELLAGVLAGGGAALLPDLDHPSGTAAKTWGPITRILGRRIGRTCGGHRAGTHTVLAAVLAAVGVYAAMSAGGGYRWAALPLVALMVGLCLVAWEDLIPGRKWERLWPANLAASLGIAGALLLTGLADRWLPVAVGVGWLAHVVGDAMTVGGVRPWMPLSDAKLRLSRLRTGGRVLGLRWEPAAQGGFGVATVALLMIGIR